MTLAHSLPHRPARSHGGAPSVLGAAPLVPQTQSLAVPMVWPYSTEEILPHSSHVPPSLMRTERSLASSGSLPLPPLRASSPHVLFAEDDDTLRSLTARYLEHHGIHVCTCANGLEAYRCFVDHGRFDLLLTDILMPEMDGLDLTRLLRQIRPTLPVLFVSGFTPQPLRFEDFLSGPTIFLPKPYPLSQLLDTLFRLWSLSLAQQAQTAT